VAARAPRPLGRHRRPEHLGLLQTRKHPEMGYRSCLGIMRLGKEYPTERMEAAAERALRANATSYRSLKSILDSGMDRVPASSDAPAPSPPDHGNLRGRGYYH
jgi:hypothetical protein